MSLVVPFEEIFTKDGLLSKASHWQRVQLGSVADILNGFPLKSKAFNSTKGFPVIRIRDLKFNKIQTYYSDTFPEEYIVSNNDLLIGMDGDFICYKWNGGKAVLNQRVCKIRPNESFVVKQFLYFAINGYLKAIHKATSSVTVGHLSSIDLGKIPFPLPPINEQRRIVAKLEILFDKIETIKQRFLNISLCQHRIFLKNIFDGESFFSSVELKEFCEEQNKRIGIDWGKYRLIGVSKENGIVDLRVGGKKSFERYKIVKPGWFLYNPMRVDIGSITIWDGNETAITSPDYVVFSIKHTISPLMLLYFLKSTYGLSEINNNTQGAVRSRLYFRNLIKIKFPFSGIERHIEVEMLFKAFNRLNSKSLYFQEIFEKLKQSILSKAFHGDLVTQDPNDEPADILLDRINKEHLKKKRNKQMN